MTNNEQICYNYIKEHPGCRHREIRTVPLTERIDALVSLVERNWIYSKEKRDMANGQFYCVWYVAR